MGTIKRMLTVRLKGRSKSYGQCLSNIFLALLAPFPGAHSQEETKDKIRDNCNSRRQRSVSWGKADRVPRSF